MGQEVTEPTFKAIGFKKKIYLLFIYIIIATGLKMKYLRLDR